MNDLASAIIGVVLVVVLLWLIGFLIFRQIFLWYWKVNERLEEQRKTNVLLKGIYEALLQGNQINAITAGQVSSNTTTETVDEEDIPDL